MTNMPRLAENEPFPQQHGGEPELCPGRAAVARLMAMLDDVCRVQKQHRVRLMLVERSLRNLRRRVLDESWAASRRPAYRDEDIFASDRFHE
jgi:hypothetical protein